MYLSGWAVFHHGQDIVGVVVVPDDVALFVLANIRIVKSLWANTAALKILIHPAFIAKRYFFWISILVFCFYSKLAKAVLDPSEIEQLLTSLKVGHPLVNKHVKDVIVSGASAETMERKCFSVIYKRGVVFLMEGAAAPQILFVKILNS